MKFLKLFFARPTREPAETVRYTITNCGALTIDPEALVNSPGFQRQLEGARRLKAMQDRERVGEKGVFLISPAYRTRPRDE